MAKKIQSFIKLQIQAGKANPAPPIYNSPGAPIGQGFRFLSKIYTAKGLQVGLFDNLIYDFGDDPTSDTF